VAGDKWIKRINNSFQDKTLKVIQGRVEIPKSTYLGDCISAQGFPGGGLVGFEKMWRVDKNAFTGHITSCNFAIRKEVFQEHGYFDESFPFPGNEDSELSYRLTKQGVKIKYCSNLLVYHEPREDLMSFVKWMFSRGRSNYYFKKKVGSVRSFVMLRLWSSKNIITKFAFDRKVFLIVPLMFLSFVLQQAGYIFESFKQPVEIKQKNRRWIG
jgi:GT2 family glycosyltransferase